MQYSDHAIYFQVSQLVGYAVGEVVHSEEGEEEEEVGVSRWRPERSDRCYEVVTAWVHPGYRGLSVSVRMYLAIIKQGGVGMVYT